MRFIHLSCLMMLLSVVVALFVCVTVAVDTAAASASDSSSDVSVSVSGAHVSRVLNNGGPPAPCPTTPNGLIYQCSFKFPKKKKHEKKHEKHEKCCDKHEKHEKWCEKWEKPEKCHEKHEKCEKHDDKHDKCDKHDDKHDDKHEKPEKCDFHEKNETCCDKHEKHEKPEKHDDEKKQKCFAYGFVCFDEGPAGTLCKADDIAKPMVVQCTNGFSLYEDDAADELEEQALWLNADGVEPEVTATTPPSFATPSPGNKVVTLYVQNFEPLTQGQTTGTFNRTATLLISEPCGLVKRVNGQCSFAFVKDFNGIVAVLAPQGGVPLLIEDADEDEDEEEDD